MMPQQARRRRRRAAMPRIPERRVVVARGAGGFGFTIAGQRPCVVSAVAVGGPAARAGLRAGDALLAVDGASVSRAPHAAVARLVAAAPQAISLSVAPRDPPPTDTEDTEPDERSRTRRRHPPPRRRPHHAPLMHHPGCHAAPSTSSVNELLQNLSRAQLSASTHAARLECRVVVGYLGTIETPRAASETPPGSVKTAVRRLRQERRPAANVLLSVLPNVLILRRPTGQTLAQYARERIVYAGCSSDADRRYFGLVTAAELAENETDVSYSCHVFAVDSRLAEHEAHVNRAREFQIACSRDPVAERCLEFPPSAEYVVGVIKGMYSLPADDCASPALQQLSKLAVKGDSPALANFSRCNRAALRIPRNLRRPNCRHEDNRMEGPDFVANSPQPSNHSEVTTTSSNSDSGIGFHNDGRNIAERILVVEFGGQPPLNPYRAEAPLRPLGMVGCNFEDASFLSNTTPVVDGFGGQGRPLNHLDDVMLNANDVQHLQRYPVNPARTEDTRSDTYNYNNLHYGNIASTSKSNGAVYDSVYTEAESPYELLTSQIDDLDIDQVTESFNSVEIYEEKRPTDYQSNEAESTDNVTVISGTASKASMDSVSVYSSRSHEEPRPTRRKHLQASLDDMLVLGLRDEKAIKGDDDTFVHPSSIKCKVRKSKPLNLLSRTKNMLAGKDGKRSRALSASAGEVCGGDGREGRGAPLQATTSVPDLSSDQSDQSSPFRRWTTSSGAGSSYRHHDHRNNLYNKQMSEGSPLPTSTQNAGVVSRWSLGLEQLLCDPAGAAAFAHFLHNEFAAENIRFWWSCEQYNKCTDDASRSTLAQQIWSRHLADGAPEPVNIDAVAKRTTALRLCHQPPPLELFQPAQKQIFNVMKFDSYPRFLRSAVHAECARADLRGLPQPYALADTDTANKVKKSASNVSERRRSGGVNLLPWRLRTHSKDRDHAHSANNISTTSHTLTDVVKSTGAVRSGGAGGAGGAGVALCRVILPDGATSVVGVEDNTSVRQLIDRLMQRRNILCASYDVLLRDTDKGECSVVEWQSPSSVLGGREAVVERRCVVRLELAGRCLCVRCRPSRRLRHALQPVLNRYSTSGEPIVLRDQVVVHMDTLMEELDGARLKVIFKEEKSDDVLDSVAVQRDTQTHIHAEHDSLAEFAVRLNDDCDTQSGCGSTGGGSGGGSVGGSGGRVRAALRPGAPLHQHPPDFLDNLRETQRLRLQNRSEPGGGSIADIRSPPPLPPKPRSAQTTALV